MQYEILLQVNCNELPFYERAKELSSTFQKTLFTSWVLREFSKFNDQEKKPQTLLFSFVIFGYKL